jgi:ferredoxin
MELIDLGVLAAALALAALLVLKLRSRRAVLALMIFSLLYFGFYRMGCLCPVGSVQNVSSALSGRTDVSLDDRKIDAALAGVALSDARRAAGLDEREFRRRLRQATRQAAKEAIRLRLSRFDAASITDTPADRPGDAGRFSLSLRRNAWNRTLLEDLETVELPPAVPGAPALALGQVWHCEDRLGVLPWVVVAIFALPLIATLFFGRVFCASVCPLGAVQDAVLIRPLRIPAFLEHPLRLLAVAYLAFAVLLAVTGSTYLVCKFDPFVTLFRIVPVGKWLRWRQQWASFGEDAGDFFTNATGRWELLLLPISFLVISAFVGRPYCRFLCPYAVLLRPLSRLSWRHASITPDECIQCRLCEDACPFGAIDKPTPAHVATGWDRRRLVIVMAVAPVLLAAGAWGGWALGRPLARAHLKLRLADRLALEKQLRAAETAAGALPAEIDGRTISVETSDAALTAVCKHKRGFTLWRRKLLDFEADRVLEPPNAGRVRAAATGDGAEAVLIVRWTRLDAAGAAEELKSLYFLDIADGQLRRREDLSATYDPAEAFARRSYIAAGEAVTGGGRPGEPLKERMLAADVAALAGQFRWGGLIVGLVVAAAVAGSLLTLSVRRTRTDYEANRASCVSCARCFHYCPREHLRRQQREEPKNE